MASTALGMLPCAVRSSTGRSGWMSRSSSRTDSPSRSGRRRSVRARSKTSRLATARASSPAVHVVTSKPMADSRIVRSRSRPSSSSTTRMRSFVIGPSGLSAFLGRLGGLEGRLHRPRHLLHFLVDPLQGFKLGGQLLHLPFQGDRKSTRLNSSHLVISYAVFCLKKKKKKISEQQLYKTINSS